MTSSDHSVHETNAAKWLRSQGVAFQVAEYDFHEVGAELAAAGVGRPLEMVCKTLVLKGTGKTFWVAVVPGDQQVTLWKVGKAVGDKHVDMAPPEEAERVTGYKVGGISPFAMKRRLPALVEESLLVLETIMVNAGRRGVLVELRTDDLVRLLEARCADICG